MLLLVLLARQTDRRSAKMECTGSGLFGCQGASPAKGCFHREKRKKNRQYNHFEKIFQKKTPDAKSGAFCLDNKLTDF